MFLGINTKPRLINTQGKPQWPPKGGNDDVHMHIIIVWRFSKKNLQNCSSFKWS
jgi:hypothetical protein